MKTVSSGAMLLFSRERDRGRPQSGALTARR